MENLYRVVHFCPEHRAVRSGICGAPLPGTLESTMQAQRQLYAGLRPVVCWSVAAQADCVYFAVKQASLLLSAHEN